jgi:recombination protein RecA
MLPQSVVDLLSLPLSAPASPQLRALSTGVEALDAGLAGGGLPRGRLTEVVGARGSGKATLLRRIVEQTLGEAGWVAYIDATRTLAPRDWAHLGDREGLWMIRPRDPARAAWCADVLLRCGAFALVVIDSAPVASRGVTVRLTRLARESGAALIIAGEEGGGSLVGGAVRLRVRRSAQGAERGRGHQQNLRSAQEDKPSARSALCAHPPPRRERRMTIVVEKGGGGTHRIVEVNCAIGVARRLCTHSEVPDRRGVARRPTGRPGSERRAAPVAVSGSGVGEPNESAGRFLARKRRCAEPEFGVGDLHAAAQLRAIVEHPAPARALG